MFSTELAFPEGLQANAGAADGLETCSAGQVGFEGLDSETGGQLESTIERQRFSAAPALCPDASKIGEVDVHSPLLEHDLKGFAYLAAQNTNPFASPLVLYFVAEDPGLGRAPEARRRNPDHAHRPADRHLQEHAAAARRNDQAAPVRRPARDARDAALLPPVHGQRGLQHLVGRGTVERTSSFTPEGGPNGTRCQSEGPLPFSPSLTAGSANNHAGAYSAFTLTIKRPDGQEGLTGVIDHPAGGPGRRNWRRSRPCQEPPNEVEWSCGPDSQIGVPARAPASDPTR